MPVSSISAIFSQDSECVAMENWPTSFWMLRPASGFFVPWHSKQYFWKAGGGVAAEDGAVPRRGVGAGAWADSIDASATTPATHNPERVIGLQEKTPGRGGAETRRKPLIRL